jgi:hypothetical protein
MNADNPTPRPGTPGHAARIVEQARMEARLVWNRAAGPLQPHAFPDAMAAAVAERVGNTH